MSWSLIYYILSLLDCVRGITLLLMVISLICTMALTMHTFVERDNTFKPHIKTNLKILVSTALLLIFVPQKNDAIIIAGLHYSQNTVGEQIEKLPPKLLELINKELDESLKKEGSISDVFKTEE